MGKGDTTLISFLWLVICVVLTIGLAYWFTRYIASRGGFGTLNGGRQMEVLDQLTLGRDQKMVLVRAGGRYLLLGVTPAGISLLAELTAEEAASWKMPQEAGEKMSFSAAFEAVLKQKKRR